MLALLIADMATVGVVFTVTVKVVAAAVAQPAPLVPVTLYMVVALGLTTVFVVMAWLVLTNVYVPAPVGVIVAFCPEQMVLLLAVSVTVGMAFTVTPKLMVLVLGHCVALVPITL